MGNVTDEMSGDLGENLSELEKKKGRQKKDRLKKRELFRTESEKDLPLYYGKTYIVLLPVDLKLVYAYWEITSKSLDRIKNKLGRAFSKSRCVIRMYDVTQINFDGRNANSFFDIDVNLTATSRYINLSSDGKAYCAEIGLIAKDGHFYNLSPRSNVLQTYLERSSYDREDQWVKIDMDLEKSDAGQSIPPSDKSFSNENQSHPHPCPLPEGEGYVGKSLSLRERDLLLPPLHPFPEGEEKRVPSPSRGGKGGDGVKGVFSGEIKNDRSNGNDPVPVFLFDGDNGTGVSDEITNSSDVTSSGSQTCLTEIGLPEGMSLEMINSSNFKEQPQKIFWLTLNAELILYGSTEPNSQVTLLGRPVDVKEDGTFTVRFSIPDGMYVIPVVARSSDSSEEKAIITTISRNTISLDDKQEIGLINQQEGEII